MARETVTRLLDDLDGGVAHETVSFGIDGVMYEIDLSSKNAKKLRSELAVYIDKGSRLPQRRSNGVAPPGAPVGVVAPRPRGTRTGRSGSGLRQRASRSPSGAASARASWRNSTGLLAGNDRHLNGLPPASPRGRRTGRPARERLVRRVRAASKHVVRDHASSSEDLEISLLAATSAVLERAPAGRGRRTPGRCPGASW